MSLRFSQGTKEVTMSNNKQSSVEWAISKITMICAFYNRKEMSVETFEYYHKDIVQKAKAWHKEEMKQTYFDGWHRNIGNRDEDFEHYYNETFGGNNEQQ